MKRVRDFLWKYLGMTLNLETLIVMGVVVLSCVATIVLGILAATMHSSALRTFAILAAIPAIIITLGSSYTVINWSLSSKSDRKEIEEKVALDQLKRRVNDKHYER